jgi:hypothetical protein
MTDDLVKRLREAALDYYYEDIIAAAADRIEEMEAALRKIETLELDPRNSGQMWVEALRQIARAALKGKTDDIQNHD